MTRYINTTLFLLSFSSLQLAMEEVNVDYPQQAVNPSGIYYHDHILNQRVYTTISSNAKKVYDHYNYRLEMAGLRQMFNDHYKRDPLILKRNIISTPSILFSHKELKYLYEDKKIKFVMKLPNGEYCIYRESAHTYIPAKQKEDTESSAQGEKL